MGRIAYYIKDVRENTNTHGDTSAAAINPDHSGNRTYGGKTFYKFYEWPSDLTDAEATGTVHGALAYLSLVNNPNIYNAIDRSDSHTQASVSSELQAVYDESKVLDEVTGNELRLRVGRQILVFGYAYSASGAVADDATINWKE
mgnify:CR=1 FL=1